MKTKLIIVIALTALLASLLPAYDNYRPGRSGAWNRGSAAQGSQNQHQTLLQNIKPSDLNEAEKAGLLRMREEEKLARDVYQYLSKKWNLRSFDNIGRSEQTHMDWVKDLLVRYNLEDPAKNDQAGVFTSQEMAGLYAEMTARGSRSAAEAFKVGVEIEKLDIADLERLLKQTDNEDLKLVYGNLDRASYNHLRAFERQAGR